MILELLQAIQPVQIPQYDSFQDWLQDTSYIEMILKGLVIGIMVSAPMGPVGVLCIQRTLNKGRWEGFATGLGATLSDLLYAIITGFTMKFFVDIINERIAWWGMVIFNPILFLFGIYTFYSKPKNCIKPVKRKKGTLFNNFISGFLITVSNPTIIILFVTMFATNSFIIVNNIIAQIIGYLFIIVGAIGWWFGLTWLVNKVRNKYNVRIIWILNRSIGVAVMLFAIIMLIATLTGHNLNLDQFKIPFNIV